MNKKLLSLTAVLFAFAGLVSCEEDDQPTYVAPNYLAGKWVLSERGTLNSQNVINYAPAENNGCIADDVTFNADFTFDTTFAEFDGTNCMTISQDGTYELVPGNVVLNYTDENTADEFPGEVATFTLRALSDTELVVATTDINNDLVFLKFLKASE